jgi:hypothetical protein
MSSKYPKYATIFSIASEQCRSMGIEIIDGLLGNVLPASKVHSYLGEYAPELAVRLFGDASHTKRLVTQHSHFRLIGKLLTRATESAVSDSVLSGGFGHRKLFDDLRSKGGIEARVLRSCEHCVSADLKKFGVAHWRVFHQWPGMQTCEMHGSLLHENCTKCGEPRLQRDTPLMAHDPCDHCGCWDFGPRELAPDLIEEQMVNVFYDLYFRAGEDSERHFGCTNRMV